MVELREDSPRPREDRRADAEARPAGKGAPAENAPGGAGALSAAAAAEREQGDAGSSGEWSGDDTDSDPEARTARAAPAPPPADVVERLRCYGFLARSAGAWTEQAVPVVRLRVRVHTEVDGHTCYMIESQLTQLGEEQVPITWSALRRLKQLREGVHAPLKQQLGGDYERHFSKTPFAHRSGPPGTTARLHAWFQSLAACMTAGYLSPALTATVLEALEAPRPAPPGGAGAPARRPPPDGGH